MKKEPYSTIQGLIAQDDLEAAFAQLALLPANHSLHQRLVLLQARYHNLLLDKIEGTVSSEAEELEHNRLRESLFSLTADYATHGNRKSASTEEAPAAPSLLRLRKQLDEKLRAAQLQEAFQLLEAQQAAHDYTSADLSLIQAHFQQAKVQMEQGVIEMDSFYKVFSETVINLQALVHPDIRPVRELPSRANRWNVQSHSLIRRYGIIVALLGAITIIAFLVFQFGLFTSPSASPEDWLKDQFAVLTDISVPLETKDSLISILVSDERFPAKVAVIGEEGTVLQQYDLADFLHRLSFGEFVNFKLEALNQDLIRVKISSF
ncbi:MAG: hypothetical protein AAFR61_05450 [Bacteroidota bacterium]